MRVLTPKKMIIAVLIGSVLLLVAFSGEASSDSRWHEFDRWDPNTPSPTGQSVAVECNADADHPETWSNAEARLRLRERGGTSVITVTLRDARPHTLYTVWVRLLGVDSEGNPYGGSPLTGIPVTPLVPTDELPEQVAITPPNSGSDEVSNGFWTNRRGHGRAKIIVDFPITAGAYPFQRFPDWETAKTDVALTNDGNLERLGNQPAALRPEAIASSPQAPATFLIASHCVDEVAHGLLPGPHENWFTWSAE